MEVYTTIKELAAVWKDGGKDRKMIALCKFLFLFVFGGSIYYGIEMFTRGFSHWSMFVLAGFCGCLFIDGLNNMFSYEMDFVLQVFMCMILVTICEYYVGCAVNKEVFNLDLMNSEELELLLESVEKEKNKVKREIKKLK